MLYSTQPTQSDDGTYFVKATTDEKRKKFVQLNQATVVDEGDFDVADVSLELTSSGVDKILDVDAENIQAAVDNSEAWFGKQMTDAQIRRAYQPSSLHGVLGCDVIPATKIFNADLETTGIDALTEGRRCKVIVEFSGLWFAKKTFGPIWNLVQVKLFADPIVDDYPEDYAFEDTDEDDDVTQEEDTATDEPVEGEAPVEEQSP